MTLTRQEYMEDGENLHRKYYAQFVNEEVKKKVIRYIGKDLLLTSKDAHLNDIPLHEWDALSGFIFRGSEIVSRPYTIEPIKVSELKLANEGVSPATLVCIYKEAAKQLIEELKNS